MAVATDTARTAGSMAQQLPCSATASDVTDVVIAGELMASTP
jgi:hypothetical protein